MNISTEQYNRICLFLDAEMTLEEMNAFEKELIANPLMRQQLDFEQSVRDGFAIKKNDTATSDNGHIVPLPNVPAAQLHATGAIKKISSRQKWIAFAAAASLVGIITTIVLQNTKKQALPNLVIIKDTIVTPFKDTTRLVIKKPEIDSSNSTDFARLFKQYFVPDAAPEEKPMYLAEALIDYEAGDYKTLLALNLNTVDGTRGAGDVAEILALGHYYKGIAYLKTNQPAKAISNLQWVLQHSGGKGFKEKAHWYLAMGYLKNKQKEKAVVELKKIAITKKAYTHKTVKLLEELQ